MPVRHFLATAVTIVATATATTAVELTLTDANYASDDIRVSQSGASVTITDGASVESPIPKNALPAERRVVAFPDLTRQGRKPTQRPSLATPRTAVGGAENEQAVGQEHVVGLEDAPIGAGLSFDAYDIPDDDEFDVESIKLCGCPAHADCSCSTDYADGRVGGIIADSLGGCGGRCGGACGPGCRQGLGGIVLDFWLAQGLTWNPDDPTNGFNLPVTFNDRADEYQLNQLYLVLGSEVSTDGGWDLGGRVDLLYGTDYFFTQAAGLELRSDGTPRWNSSDGPRRAAGSGAAMYGLAMPQLYMEVFAPIGPGINVKFGHFYTAIGYESVMAPENFFYSHAYTMQYGEPFTHTGMLAEMPLTRRLDMLAGFTRGWDNWEDNNGQLGFLGGLSWTAPSELASVALTVHSSNEDADGQNNRTVYSLVYTRQIGCRLQYILQHDFGVEELAEVGQDGTNETAKWYGINNYLIYDVSECVSLGLRAEWFRDQDNSRVLALPIESLVQGGNYFALTAGANWSFLPRWTLRPEIRWDWSDVEVPSLGRSGMFNDFTDDNQITLATDLIFRF